MTSHAGVDMDFFLEVHNQCHTRGQDSASKLGGSILIIRNLQLAIVYQEPVLSKHPVLSGR